MSLIPIEERVTLFTRDDAGWDWDSSNPTIYTKTPNADYGKHEKFDPFPCYSHPKDLVIEQARKVEKSFPVGFPTYYYIYPYESLGRTNGQASWNTVEYGNEEQGKRAVWEGQVFLFGKRIPLHPAMTRYLVAHEYGHIVDYWICNRRLLPDSGFDEEYARMRGLPKNDKYGGGKWHTNTGEIIANDFRICVAGVEREFWPHECKHPDEDDNVKNWWYDAMLKYATVCP